MNSYRKYRSKDGEAKWLMGGLVSFIFFLMSALIGVSCSSGTSADYVPLLKQYDLAHDAQMKGDLTQAMAMYKDCINQCSHEQYMEDDSVKQLLPRAMGQVMNTFQSQGDQMGCVEYFDSLKREVDDNPTSYNKVLAHQFKRDVYVLLSYSLSRTEDVRKAADLMDEALQMPLSYPVAERKFRDDAYAAAVYYCLPDQQDKVLLYGRKALNEVRLCMNKSGAQWLVVMLGGIYHRQGDVDKALSMYQEGYELAVAAHDTLGMANAKKEIAEYLLQWNLYGSADKFATQAVHLLESTSNKNPMVETCVYVTKAKILKAQHQKAKALEYLKKAKGCSTGLPYNSGVSDVDYLLGSLLVNTDAPPCYPEDYANGMKILQYASRNATLKIQTAAFLEMAKAYIAKGNQYEGELELDTMYALSRSGSVSPLILRDGYRYASEYYQRQGNQAKAAVYVQALRQEKAKAGDAISSQRVVKAIAKMEAAEREKMLQQQRDEANKRFLKVVVSVCVLIAFSLACVYGSYRKHRKEKSRQSSTQSSKEKVDLLGILKGKGLEAFQKAFDQAYPSFMNAIRDKVPRMSAKEELYCRLMVLEVDNGELAEIFGVARSSVIVAKFRLRKKVALEQGQTLEDYLQDVLHASC